MFARGGDYVRIQRVEPTRLVVFSPAEEAQRHDFASIGALLDFQVDYERQLIDSGWRLVEFSPERRRLPQGERLAAGALGEAAGDAG